MRETKRHLCGSKAHLSAVMTIGAFNVPIGDKGVRRLHAKEGSYESTRAPPIPYEKRARGACLHARE